jgi:hypothetical protein
MDITITLSNEQFTALETLIAVARHGSEELPKNTPSRVHQDFRYMAALAAVAGFPDRHAVLNPLLKKAMNA